jgi:PPM family protein phosphatase
METQSEQGTSIPQMASSSGPVDDHRPERLFDLALLSDVGMTRSGNEDSCGQFVENEDSVLFAVADGVGGYEGGEVASAIAIETTIQAYRESPAAWGAAKRLHRAVQQANIEIHNKAIAVPELRGMATTLTAVVVDKGILSAAHVGDCRLYLARHHKITQITKDHTAVGERVRMGLMSAEAARVHPERSIILRSLGRDLIVSVDRITMPLVKGDRLILCSDGLHGVLQSHEIEHATREMEPETACQRMIDEANSRGTQDNLTCVVFRINADTGHAPTSGGIIERLRGWFGR